ncbi:hypothetical protein CLV51_101831 [Chitinophaga niastensis]|uniref:Uncharacterized protein n=1 Tax=Chitinophaga niastensis TaxID=536980 RepID=A0A2P8HTE4_CHINA|nr:hypothetical protein [Chitinophaga niastensis]PSL49497.1 hypothetical protein CLV51_101831 [Chitinophaga niastensis]
MQTSQLSTTPFFHYSHLNAQESADPMLAVDRFCELFPPATARQILWLWLSETLAAEDTQYEDAQNRADLLLLYNELLRLLDANYILSFTKLPSQQLIGENRELVVLAS